MQKRIFSIILAMGFILCFAFSGLAIMGSENFRIPFSVVSGGGEAMASANFNVQSNTGLPNSLVDPEAPLSSDSYELYVGFWYIVYSDWPSSERTVEMHIPQGWSMISLPVMPESPRLRELFPEAVVVYGYYKGLGYVRLTAEDALESGKGYWILLNEGKTYTLTGQPIKNYNLPIHEDGWHMIGGCKSAAKASINKGNIGVIYGYAQGIGYQRVRASESIEPCKGYWIEVRGITDPAQLSVEAKNPHL